MLVLKKKVEKRNEFQLFREVFFRLFTSLCKTGVCVWYSIDEVKPEKVGLNLNKKLVINNFYLSVITNLNYNYLSLIRGDQTILSILTSKGR